MKRMYFTEQELPAFVAAAYELSRPQGLGFLHFEAGPLPPNAVAEIVAQPAHRRFRLSMDYIGGRAVKMTVHVDPDGRLWIEADHWHDHSPNDLAALAERLGLTAEEVSDKAQAA